eukprot:gb/GECH01001449.1/.p1 GENE.gb/GECH01001449.1/~~gb/GECH01001449.1/.p1  ORF type:complete len:276 (+),score=88.09 gb/GECH01001449.1/:1-828(+)
MQLQAHQSDQKRSLYLCFDYLKSVAKDIEEQSDPEKDPSKYDRDHKTVEELEEQFKEVIQQQDELTAHYEVLQDLASDIRNETQQPQQQSIDEFTEKTKNKYQEKKQQKLESKSYTEEALRENDQYVEFKSTIWNVHHNEPLPWQEDEDVIVGTQDTSNVSSLVCPITKMLFEEPVKCVTCKHTYEKEAIIRLIGRKREQECPVAGCNGLVSRDTLEPDVEMETRVQRAKEREEYQKGTQNNDISSISLDDDDIDGTGNNENNKADNNDADLDLL